MRWEACRSACIAPLVFKTYAEWKIGLVAGFVLAAGAFVLAGYQAGDGRD